MDYRFPFARKDDGFFREWTLEQIARHPAYAHEGKRLSAGILWLREISDWAAEKGAHQHMVRIVREFLTQPEVAAALDRAEGEAKDFRARRSIKKNRRAKRDRIEREEYADRNLERGF